MSSVPPARSMRVGARDSIRNLFTQPFPRIADHNIRPHTTRCTPIHDLRIRTDPLPANKAASARDPSHANLLPPVASGTGFLVSRGDTPSPVPRRGPQYAPFLRVLG